MFMCVIDVGAHLCVYICACMVYVHYVYTCKYHMCVIDVCVCEHVCEVFVHMYSCGLDY